MAFRRGAGRVCRQHNIVAGRNPDIFVVRIGHDFLFVGLFDACFLSIRSGLRREYFGKSSDQRGCKCAGCGLAR